ncbi:Alpha-1-antitrypsin [Thelohanellus kitauei]|uniref:Alpha-1-antitrypsin n=1 Tax=Thelohanellus kitauei TaxID=669202 RepID=A0A0C2NFD2_THEKT|nr:Alpha-1-antitrypsin [Thelohanellus kitauei]
MSIFSVNEFGQTILSNLFQSKNYTGNIAFSSPSLFVVMSIIKAALGRQTISKLSHILYYDVNELQKSESWCKTSVGKKLSQMYSEIKSTTTTKSIIFHSFKIIPSFVKSSQELIDIHYHKCDVVRKARMARIINEWVGKNTRRVFINLYRHPLDSKTKMIIITTLYFFTDWINPFDPRKTRTENFTDDTGQKFNVNMMRQTGLYKIYPDPINNLSIIFIPLVKSDLSAVVVLPSVGYPIQDMVRGFKV